MRFNDALWAATERIARDRNMSPTEFIRSLMHQALKRRKRRNRVHNDVVLSSSECTAEGSSGTEIIVLIDE
jgi:hypothetical protein